MLSEVNVECFLWLNFEWNQNGDTFIHSKTTHSLIIYRSQNNILFIKNRIQKDFKIQNTYFANK